MPCPNCDHTMQNLGVEAKFIFWCPRCGTVKTETRKYVDGKPTGEITFEEHELPRWQRLPREIPAVLALRDVAVEGLLIAEQAVKDWQVQFGVVNPGLLALAQRFKAAIHNVGG